MVGGNAGIGWTFNIPQQSRYFNPETGETKILKEGYTTQSVCSLYGNFKMGYEIIQGIKVYGSYTYSFRSSFEVGVKLSSSK